MSCSHRWDQKALRSDNYRIPPELDAWLGEEAEKLHKEAELDEAEREDAKRRRKDSAEQQRLDLERRPGDDAVIWKFCKRRQEREEQILERAVRFRRMKRQDNAYRRFLDFYGYKSQEAQERASEEDFLQCKAAYERMIDTFDHDKALDELAMSRRKVWRRRVVAAALAEEMSSQQATTPRPRPSVAPGLSSEQAGTPRPSVAPGLSSQQSATSGA